jgi:hypothetical protein
MHAAVQHACGSFFMESAVLLLRGEIKNGVDFYRTDLRFIGSIW